MPAITLLLLWPLIEIAGFVWIGGAIGLGPTFGFILVSGLIGFTLVRRAGLATLRHVSANLETGGTPIHAALDGAWRILAGVLLILPGFFSSGVALLLFLPPVRAVLAGLVAKSIGPGRAGVWTVGMNTASRRETGSTIIDGEFQEVRQNPPELPPRR
jgi:UPF0716 protein FxsA